MELRDEFRMRGEVRAVVFDGDVTEKDAVAFLDGAPAPAPIAFDQTWANLVTNAGRAQMTKLIVAESTVLCRYIGLTTSAPVLALADTALPNEINRTAIAISGSFATYYQRYVAFFPTAAFGSTGIAGDGLFDTASTGGIMWAEASLTVSKSTVQALVIDHRILSSS